MKGAGGNHHVELLGGGGQRDRFREVQSHGVRAVVARLGEGRSGRGVVHRERAVQLVIRATYNLDGGDVDIVARQL